MQLTAVRSEASGPSDREIAQRIAAGDHDELQRLMRRHNQLLYRTARSILRDDVEAEDAVQEAYFLACQSIGGFRGEAKLSTWLVRVVSNEAIGRLRKRRRRAEVIRVSSTVEPIREKLDLNVTDMSPEQPEDAAIRAEVRQLLEAKIDQLPDAFRTVFVLRAVEEMTVEEVGICLGIPTATVRTRYFRAKGLLRESLAKDIDFSLQDAFRFGGDRCNRIVAGVLNRLKELPHRSA